MTTLRTVRELGYSKNSNRKRAMRWLTRESLDLWTELASRFCKPVQSSHWKSQTIRSRPVAKVTICGMRTETLQHHCNSRSPCALFILQDWRYEAAQPLDINNVHRERVALQYEQYMSDKTTSYRITSRWMLFFAPLKSTFAGTSCYQNTFPQASYEHIQALTILEVTHPFVSSGPCPRSWCEHKANGRCSEQPETRRFSGGTQFSLRSPEIRSGRPAAVWPEPAWHSATGALPLNILLSITYQNIHCVVEIMDSLQF